MLLFDRSQSGLRWIHVQTKKINNHMFYTWCDMLCICVMHTIWWLVLLCLLGLWFLPWRIFVCLGDLLNLSYDLLLGKKTKCKKPFLFFQTNHWAAGSIKQSNHFGDVITSCPEFFYFSDLLAGAFGAFVQLLIHFQLNPDRYFSFCKDWDLESGYHNCIRGKLELLPCDRQPPPASQVAIYIHVCPDRENTCS